MPLLKVHEVSKSFDGFCAVDKVSLAVEERSFHALVGPNGAGKSTLFNLITGRYRLDTGEIVFAGRDITRVPNHRVVSYGIGMSFQRAIPFSSMTVLENVVLAVLALDGSTRSPFRALHSYTRAAKDATEVLGWVNLTALAHRRIDELPQGDLKRVDIAIALASRPRLLVLDEPLAGLSRVERKQMVSFIRDLLRGLQITLLFTEHDTEAVMHLADRITVMHRGRVLAEGGAAAIRSNPEVMEAFLGSEA